MQVLDAIANTLIGITASLGVATVDLPNINPQALNFHHQQIVAQRQEKEQPANTTQQDQPEISRRRHKVTVTVSNPSDILVKEGDRVQAGQILADRVEERERLTEKRRQLELAIAQISEPLPPPPPPPEPDYSVEKATISAAKQKLAYWESLPEPEFRFKQEQHIMTMDKEILRERQELARQKIEAQEAVNDAIANLNRAKAQHQQRLYEYQQQLQRHEQQNREQKFNALQLQEQLTALDEKIEEITAVRSPYSGRVRKVKIAQQNNLTLTAEIYLIVR